MPTTSLAGAKTRRPDSDQRIGNAQQSRIKVVLVHSDPLIAAGLVTLLRKRHDFEVFVSSRALTSNATARHLPDEARRNDCHAQLVAGLLAQTLGDGAHGELSAG
jgi:hypothetical protein